jgi:hypothetical protein
MLLTRRQIRERHEICFQVFTLEFLGQHSPSVLSSRFAPSDLVRMEGHGTMRSKVGA